jgi:NAD(P)H-dependent flavin oxidoreductase YrpB (nitropropane dioxygenase family)
MRKFNTQLTRLLNIDIPLIQAPIAPFAGPALAAAVANAGGLGMLSVGWRDPDGIRETIREVRARTDRPFGVNLVLDRPQDERLQVCFDEGIKIISLFWGDPAPYVASIHAAGALLLQTVGDAEEARRVSELGVDILVAQGGEAGGHVWGTVATLPLVPRVVDAVAPKPVVAAGGITDGRGLAAALMLGAAGVWVGTRFVASEEARAHPLYQERILAARETDTVIGTIFDQDWPDAPSRTLRNETIRQWEAAGKPLRGRRPNENDVVAYSPDGSPHLRYSTKPPMIDTTGRVEEMALYAGQGVGLVSRIQPAAEIVSEIAEGAAQVLSGAAGLVSP